jgi:hypothetical protein
MQQQMTIYRKEVVLMKESSIKSSDNPAPRLCKKLRPTQKENSHGRKRLSGDYS